MDDEYVGVEDQDLEYELDQNDVLEYAKQIGIDVKNEPHLLWIAEEGLVANLPKGWFLFSNEEDQLYYCNTETGEKSLQHPLDKEFVSLVIKERKKAFVASLSESRPESKSPLDPIHDVSQSSGRFPKAPLPQLSSLSDAPPLSPSPKPIPSFKHGSSNSAPPEKKFDMGRFENRRGAKLAPVKLNTLKMPVSSPKTGSMSFMPKGSSLARNIRRAVPEEQSNYSIDRSPMGLLQDDSNESFNSDDGSKYSYEETDEDADKSYGDPNHSDAGTHFSPTHSANDSPEAFDINSLVQLGSKLNSRTESAKRTSQLQSVVQEEHAPTLSLRKAVQPSVLKPLQQVPAKKVTPKAQKKTKKTSPQNSKMNFKEAELEEKINVMNEEQRLVLETIQKEWANMQDNVEKEEKAKYDELVKDISDKYDDEEILLRKENEEKLLKLEAELLKKVEEEETAGKARLKEIKEANEMKFKEEEENFRNKLVLLSKSQDTELANIKGKYALEVAKKENQLKDDLEDKISEISSSHEQNVQNLKEAHTAEIALLEKAHKAKMVELQEYHSKEVTDNKESQPSGTPSNEETEKEMEKTQLLLQEEKYKYQEMLSELEKLRSLIEEEKEALEKLEEKTSSAQTSFEEIQDELDKAENDLDNLRSEKSALVSELNILKSSIKSEKANLQNLAKASNFPVKRRTELMNKSVNTDVCSTLSSSSQTSLDTVDAFCQTLIEVQKSDAESQTCLEKSFETSDTSCQVNIYQNEFEKSKSVSKSKFLENMPGESEKVDDIVSKIIHNSITEVNNKIDARFKSMEDLIGSIKNSMDTSVNRPGMSNTASKNNNTTLEDVNDTEVLSDTPSIPMTSVLPLRNTVPLGGAIFNKKKCNCDNGESNVMQDVKNSIYRLNDILSSNFIPSISNNEVPFVTNCSSSLDSFYSQFRKLQEKQRAYDLKYKRAGGYANQHGSLSGMNFVVQDQFNHNVNPNSYSENLLEDPIVRARKLVLKEQARSWRQQQQLLAAAESQPFLPLERSYNASMFEASHSASSTSSGFGERTPIQYPFLKFESNPDSDYNAWMSRLKTLQDKIRSHKLL